MVEGEDLSAILSFSVEVMDTITERDLIVPLQIKESAMIRKASLLTLGDDSFDKEISLAAVIFAE